MANPRVQCRSRWMSSRQLRSPHPHSPSLTLLHRAPRTTIGTFERFCRKMVELISSSKEAWPTPVGSWQPNWRLHEENRRGSWLVQTEPGRPGEAGDQKAQLFGLDPGRDPHGTGLGMDLWKTIFLYNPVFFRFHVSLPGCTTFWLGEWPDPSSPEARAA